MLVVGLAVALPVVVIAREDDDTPAPESISVEPPQVGNVNYDRSLGVEYRLPDGWNERKRGKVLLLRSEDGRARVAVSAPGPARDADQLRQEVLREFRRIYAKLKIQARDRKARIGGLKARTLALRARPRGKGKKASDLAILVSTASGEKRAYLVVAYTPAYDPGESTLEAQSLIQNLEFVS